MKNIVYLLLALFTFFGCNPSTQNDTTEEDDMLENFDFQGHRGARGLVPENTIPAFLKALEYGVTTLELDVVISKDSQIVLSHEPWFNHSIALQPDGEGISEEQEKEFNLYQMTYEEIEKYDVGSLGNPRFPDQEKQKVAKPTLQMVTDAVATYLRENNLPPVYYNIETKSESATDNEFHPAPERFVELLYNEVQRLGIAEYTTIQSFDVRTLEALHVLDTNISTALLIYYEEDSKDDIEKSLETLSFQPDIYSCYYKYVTDEMISIAHQKSIKIIPWTVNEPSDMKQFIQMGVDGLITDYHVVKLAIYGQCSRTQIDDYFPLSCVSLIILLLLLV